jgi:DNA replication and repair protein RecF
LVWVQKLAVRDFRILREVDVSLDPCLNVFTGKNAQGKTSLLEALGVVARGRSFRTDSAPTLIRRGAAVLRARARAGEDGRFADLEVAIAPEQRRFTVDGRAVAPREYSGRLEVVVYSTERLRVVRGTLRDRRLFFDRSASALWPAYRSMLRDFERVLLQRNRALRDGTADLAVWTDRLADVAARVRLRRAMYVARLSRALAAGFRPSGEAYELGVDPSPAASESAERAALLEELRRLLPRERFAGRTLAGPHRDAIRLRVDGRDASVDASAGQARSLLLALALATLEVYREETGRAAVALLDDLDSELDPERASHLCSEVVRRGQAFVTSAHPQWAQSLRPLGQVFHVAAGEVHCP